MKVLIQGYNTFRQNQSGGVQSKILSYVEALRAREDIEVKCFNQFTDKISDFDLIHFFKMEPEHLPLMRYAKHKGKKIVLSSIVPIGNSAKIKAILNLAKILPVHPAQETVLKVLQYSDIIITETNKELEYLSSTYGVNESKMVTIPNGVNNILFEADSKIAMNKFGLHQKVVLVPGLIDSNKNQLSVIRALKGTNIPVLILGGENPLDSAYMRQCEREATDNIKFTGWIPYGTELWASCFALAKVVVLPSFKEIYGNVIFEGAAVGANIVCTNALPIEEWGFSNLIYGINPCKVEDIKEKIVLAYNSEDKYELSNLIKTNYTWEAVVEAHCKIYKSLIEGQ